MKYYTELIASHEDWMMVDIYADEGISGTQVKHCENFIRMIDDCKSGRLIWFLRNQSAGFPEM